MIDYNLTEAQENLANLIWNFEPLKSSELVKLCESKFSWKKSTTYTMLKQLQDKNIFQNENSVVSSLISKSEFYAERGKIFIDKNFGGSLPRFITAFSGRKKLSEKEVKALQKLIDEYKEV